MPQRRRIPPSLRALLVLVVVVAVVGVGLVARDWWQDRDDCGDAEGGVKRSQGECVGVTDGSARPFDTALKGIQEKIFAENRHVDSMKGVRKATIAYLAPMTVTAKDPVTTAEVRHELEGAYIAQLLLNERSSDTADVPAEPQIKILLANSGGESRQWQHTVAEIARRDNIVAVAGLGPSTEGSRAAMARLAELQIPMVGSIITATDILGADKRPLDARDGLFRIAPTNADEVDAVLKAVPPKGKPFLIQDNNRRDIYAQDLAHRFRAARIPNVQTESYITDQEGRPAGGNPFLWMRAQICGGQDTWLFFAGRGKQLQAMLEVFADNPCAGQNITIVSGDDALNIDWTNQKVKTALSQRITLRYAGLAHPQQWLKLPQFGEPFTRFRTKHEQHQFKPDDLVDGTSMMAHDAVLTAASAIRNASSNVSKEGVLGMLLQLHGRNHVQGASGRIDLDTTTGKVTNKAIPILQITPRGVRVDTVAFPTGKPT
ncbi:hypothetical protein SMC26_00775 [Actinomadura fulvescens]|uniref:ABC transporter substrate-binding protein n=1 Tax=Actinomadura fulvescens TaxID=46160 RepID=A0ABP6C0M8_9ACTN